MSSESIGARLLRTEKRPIGRAAPRGKRGWREASYRTSFVTARMGVETPPPWRHAITDLVRVQGEVGPQQAARVSVVVVLHLVHVVGRVPDLHVYASVGHGLPLDALAPEESPLVNNTPFIFPQLSGFILRMTELQLLAASLFYASSVYLLTSASVCRRKHPLPPPRSRLPAGPEAR